jgi:molybdopterin biosynthesis enzyme
MKAALERDTYLPARLNVGNDGRLVATPVKWQGSSDLIGFAGADALLALTAGQTVTDGDVAEIYFL